MARAASSPGLLQACDDPRLLNVPLWDVQRTLLQGVEDNRLNVWRCGRRSGKSTAAAALLAWDACLRPHLDGMVLSGTGRHSVAVATASRQARLVLATTLAILESSPLLASLIDTVSEDSISLKNKNTISAFPIGSRSARGWAVSALVMDEIGHFIDGDGNAGGEATWRQGRSR